MGHISPSAAKKLVMGNFIDRVELDGSVPKECETCIFAKMSRKPIPKQCQGEQAKKNGGTDSFQHLGTGIS